MSSATILFVLQRILAQSAALPASIAAMAFGPGLTVECGLLRIVPSFKPAIIDESPMEVAVP